MKKSFGTPDLDSAVQGTEPMTAAVNTCLSVRFLRDL